MPTGGVTSQRARPTRQRVCGVRTRVIDLSTSGDAFGLLQDLLQILDDLQQDLQLLLNRRDRSLARGSRFQLLDELLIVDGRQAVFGDGVPQASGVTPELGDARVQTATGLVVFFGGQRNRPAIHLGRTGNVFSQ